MPRKGHGVSSASSDGCARDERGRLVVSSYAEVTRVAEDPASFSNAVSRHLQIPNGLDGPDHARATEMLAPFFHPPALDALEPVLAGLARDLVSSLGTARDA